ncbi:hypothetical protein FQR65_LT19640 [Abscondita terminalis]|nr:hypothetical protein FQR65_LT19640 [Abscondita terminalis]
MEFDQGELTIPAKRSEAKQDVGANGREGLLNPEMKVNKTRNNIGVYVIPSWISRQISENPPEMPGISEEEIKEIEDNRKIKTSHKLLSFRELSKNTNLWALMIMYFLYMFGAYFYLSWMPKYLRQGRDFDLKQAGLISLPFILGALGCLIGGWLTDYLAKRIGIKWGRRSVALTGLVIAGIVPYHSITIYKQYDMHCFVIFWFILQGFYITCFMDCCVQIYGGSTQELLVAACIWFGQIGSTIMSLAFGYSFRSAPRWNLPILLIGIITICSGLMWLRIDATKTL